MQLKNKTCGDCKLIKKELYFYKNKYLCLKCKRKYLNIIGQFDSAASKIHLFLVKLQYPMTPTEISEILDIKYTVVNTALQSLYKRNKVKKIRKGVYYAEKDS